ncbi:outer membrane protein assembly factor BamD [Segatella maculosa]|uniref:outer membrane protein assembly factor BamD n=1 Tax=Segatella maculosa TaxID=439703 RepID=UPI0023F22D27|nr:outer membrane protein assembly factor BamD [Segatella maculosa]
MFDMKKKILIPICTTLLLVDCAPEFNKVYKTDDYRYKYEFAKECYADGRYAQAITLLTDLINIEKGTDNAQESLYMLAMAEYNSLDYEGAAQAFKRYYQSYPKGYLVEMAHYYEGLSLYKSTPEPRLDQSTTVSSISAFQTFLDLFPDSKLKPEAQKRLFELQDKLVLKELYSARLYYNLGPYFGNCSDGGNNYEACIVTCQNALKDYPYTSLREDFSVLLMKSKFELAEQSVEAKRLERYQDAEDECYGFINQFPDSKDKSTAEKYIAKCKKFTGEDSSNNNDNK